MRFYATERLGPKQSVTPEGFLLCEAVPVARTGVMLYSSGELPELEADADGMIRVIRNPEDVFSADTIASAQGKPATIDHPDDDVTPATWKELAVGTAFNVRRGVGIEDDLLLADLLITDEGAIQEVRCNDLREISCGYDADYEQTEPGKARQHRIIINHLALVEAGRCGPRCAIGDKKMANRRKTGLSFRDRVLRAFKARDEEALENVLSDAPDEDYEGGTGEDGDTHVHVHLNGGASTTKGEATGDDDPAGAAVAAAGEAEPPAWFLQHVEQNNARFDAMEAAIKSLAPASDPAATGDADPDGKELDPVETKDDNLEGEDPLMKTEDEDLEGTDPLKEGDSEGTGDTKTRDSAGMKNIWQDVMAKAEILVPGVRLPTFDAKAKALDTTAALCLFRKRVLKRAITADSATAKFVKDAAGRQIVPEKLTCDAARVIFNASSAIAGAANNSGGGSGYRTSDHNNVDPTPKTVADMNKKHRDFWAAKGGSVN